LLNVFLHLVTASEDDDNNHASVGEDEQVDGTDKNNTCSEFNAKFWGSIREDENGNDECGVEGLVGKHIVVQKWGLIWLDSDQVEHICVGRHQDEDVLQEDERVVNWHGQETGSQQSSEEEVAWNDKSPSGLFINLENKGVEGLFGVLDFHDLVSSANNGDQEDWNNDGEREDNVGRDGGHLSSLGGIISLDELHDREEGKIEVGEHVVSDVHVELVLSKAVVEEHTDSGSLSKGFGEHKDYNVGNDDEAEAKHDQEQGLTKLGNTEPIVIVVNVEVVILHVQKQEWLVGQNQVRYQEWLERIVQIRNHLEVVQRDERT
jgi:general stress protein YciG